MFCVVAFCLDQMLYEAFIHTVYECKHMGCKAGVTAKLRAKVFCPLYSHTGAALSENTVNMSIRCCFLVHYGCWCLCTLPPLKHICWKISSTSFTTYISYTSFGWCAFVSVCQCIGLLDTIYQYLYYIIFWYIYECILTSGDSMWILLEM